MASNDKSIDIEDETKIIFECFVENSLEQDKKNNVIDPGTPGLTIDKIPRINNDECWSIGKALVKLADEMDFEEDETLLRQILNSINITSGSKEAFREFNAVANKVLECRISLQSIVYLFRFGYRIARDRLEQGVRDFLHQLCQWIIDIFRNFSVFSWIIDQGGWRALVPSTDHTFYNPIVIGGVVGVIGVLGFIFYKYFNARKG